MNGSVFGDLSKSRQYGQSFLQIANRLGYAPARKLIEELLLEFEDIDGSFLEQFQTTGFDARIWELYLHTFLKDIGFQILRNFPSPDFQCKKNNETVFIEAVTANESKEIKDIYCNMEKLDIMTIQDQIIPIKLGNSLYSKLQMRYWELPHVVGNPIILAIEDFHTPFSLTFTDSPLISYLYGSKANWYIDNLGMLHVLEGKKVYEHKIGNKKKPSGFFGIDGAENISAVLFSNAGTITKFNRMAWLDKYRDEKIVMGRFGTFYNHNSNCAKHLLFAYIVGNPNFPETWGQGINIIHNPNALIPLKADLFPYVNHTYLSDENIVYGDIIPFSPFASHTTIKTIGSIIERTMVENEMLKYAKEYLESL